MSQPTASPAAEPTGQVEEFRTALNHLLAADRRLRGRDHSRPGELTFAQIRTIAALGRENEMTAGQLAKSAELTPAAITSILDQLEAANIVERRRSTEDRRVCNVALTPEGWELLERKLAVWHGLWAERLSRSATRTSRRPPPSCTRSPASWILSRARSTRPRHVADPA